MLFRTTIHVVFVLPNSGVFNKKNVCTFLPIDEILITCSGKIIFYLETNSFQPLVFIFFFLT